MCLIKCPVSVDTNKGVAEKGYILNKNRNSKKLTAFINARNHKVSTPSVSLKHCYATILVKDLKV